MERFPADIRNELANYTTGVWFRAKRMASDMVLEDIVISELHKPTSVIPRLKYNVNNFINAVRLPPIMIEPKWIMMHSDFPDLKRVIVLREDGERVYYSPIVYEIFSKKILQAISDLFPDSS